MNVTRGVVSLPANYSNKNKQVSVHETPKKPAAVSTIKQGQYQHAYQKVERLERMDLSLYEEVEHYPEQSRVNQLFHVSIHV
jgi:hypothetical protein